MRITIKLGDVDKDIEVRTKIKHENTYLDKIEELQKKTNGTIL